MSIKSLYIGFASSLMIMACNSHTTENKVESSRLTDTSSSMFSIASENFKIKYNPGDTLFLKINETENRAIDSVRYALNYKAIGTVVGNELFAHNFLEGKYGIQIVKAEIFSKGSKEETTVRVDYLPSAEPKLYAYQIVNVFPHDIEAYTQGLEFYGNSLLESTGNGEGPSGKKGKSSIRFVDPRTGRVERIETLDDIIFGEGSTILDKQLYLLTYKSNEAYVYDPATLTKKKTFPYFKQMEGWGLTNNGKDLFMSDGSEDIYILDPSNFKPRDVIKVASSKGPVDSINELEWVKGKIFANFYGEDLIGIIDPATGVLEGLVDLSALKQQVKQHIDLDVLNGIAYRKSSDTFFVTGKNWDKLFEIRINWP